MHHWLIKSEPGVFGIDDLAKVKTEPWSGVRNYQARNFMWKEMKPGDLAFFYHSNAKPPGVVGVARVVGDAYADPTQFDEKSEYHDPKSKLDNPRWWLRDFELVGKFDRMITLEALKADPVLSEMTVSQRGTRLSIMPVETLHFKRVCKLAGWKP